LKTIEKFFGDLALSALKLFVLEQSFPVNKIEHAKIKNILLVVRHQMGDMLCASPMMRSLRSFYPDAHITLVTKSSTAFEQVFKHNEKEIADEVKSFEYGFENFMNLIKELRERKYDLAVVPSTVVFSATNHLIAYYSKAPIRAGVSSFNGTDNKTGFLLNVKNIFLWDSRKVHQIERNLDVIRQIGIQPEEKHIRITFNEENLKFADEFRSQNFPEGKMIVGFHPGAAKPGNVWEPARFAELAYLLHQKYDAFIFLSEGPADSWYVANMIRILKTKYGIDKISKHHGKLMDNMGIIKLLDLFITNDTGIMHLAEACDVPVIALFGPTHAFEWGPLGTNKVSIQSTGDDINNISVERVYEVCEQLIKEHFL
jgi:heptosyltransferase-2